METPCFHLFVDGFGAMGDALVCCKCGLDKYPEALVNWSSIIASLPWRVVRSHHPQYGQFVHMAIAARKRREQSNG